MLTSSFLSSVKSWWSTSAGDESLHEIVEEDELDGIIEAYSEKPAHTELALLESTPISSENEGLRCQERVGFVTKVSTNTGIIDEQFIFDLDENLAAELEVGSKVSYLAYRLGTHEEWRVKNIITVHEENWEKPEEAEEAQGPDGGEEIGVGEILGESTVLERTIVAQVECRQGRIVVLPNDLRCDLNTTSATFTPLAGDWVALDAFVQVQENTTDYSGDVLEIVAIRPHRCRKLECVVTAYDPRTRSGTVDNNIFFQREFCSPGFIPSRGDKVLVESIESSYGGMMWRALHVEPRREFEKPTIDIKDNDEFEDRQLFKDKNGVFLTKNLDFGTMEMNDRRVLELVIENGGIEPVRIQSIRFERAHSGQISFTEMPALPRSLGVGALMRVTISCLAKFPGYHKEVVVVEMAGFKIARRIFCEVKSTLLEAAIFTQEPSKVARYNYTSNRQEVCRRQMQRLESDLRAVPGVPLSKSPAFVSFRLPAYEIPTHIWDILNTPRYEVHSKILEKAPMFQRDLEGPTYTRRFQYILSLAEAESILDLRRYDIRRVKFDRKGEYLSLIVPGLAESRPSLLPGDRVEAISPYVQGPPFSGTIHRVLKNEVYIRFDPAFHSGYTGEDYSVCFLQSRGVWKKCHHGVQKVVQNLGTQWLFPTGVTVKSAQVEFEEVDERPSTPVPPASPAVSPLPITPQEQTAPSSDEEKRPENELASSTPVLGAQRKPQEETRNSVKMERNDSSSSDEGYIRRSARPAKKNSGPPLSKLLSMIREGGVDKKGTNFTEETSDSESSLHVSDIELSVSQGSDLELANKTIGAIPKNTQSSSVPQSSKSSLRLTSDSETSDAERSASDSGSKRSVKKSPRDSLREALNLYSSSGSLKNSPVLDASVNGRNTPVNGLNTPVGSQNTPAGGRNTPAGGRNTPAGGRNTPAGGRNTPAGGRNTPAGGRNTPVNGLNTSVNGVNTFVNGENSVAEDKKNLLGAETSPSGLRPLRWINMSLNSRQKDAVRNVLRGEARPLPYIIFGPPGTGKTMTLVETILQTFLLMPHSRILVSTPSNSSANLIAERLLDSKILKPGDMVRLVAYHLVESGTLPQRLVPYCALIDINAQAPVNPETTSSIPALSAKAVGRHRITISTCVSAGQLFYLDLPKDHFTHIIMDEAGQATEPEAMIALAFLSRNKGQAVLAGDPLQLGPVTPAKLAEELGLGLSFLARLLKRFPYNRDLEGFPETAGYDPRLVTRLIYNYRSVPSILKVCSEMFYDSELVPTIDAEESHEAKILVILTDALRIPRFGVVFEGVPGDDRQEADCPSWFNAHEIVSVFRYVAELNKLGIRSEDIGIITPYRKQVQKIRAAFEGIITDIPKVATVEEFQGQERLVIIVSTVRSSRNVMKADQKHHLGFVSSPQRLNVAISRARALLIVVGNPHLLCYDTYWKTLFKYCYENGAYIGCDPPLYVTGCGRR